MNANFSFSTMAPSAYSDYVADDATIQARPEVRFERAECSAVEALPRLPWYGNPSVLFGAAVVAFLLASVGLIVTWNNGGVATAPAGTTGTTAPSVASPVEGLPPAPAVAPPPATATVVVQQQAPSASRRQQAPAPQVAPPAPVVTSPGVVSPPTSTSTSKEPEPSQCTPPNCITVPACTAPQCVIDPAPDTGGSGSVCGPNIPADSCAVDPVTPNPGGTTPGTDRGGTTPGTVGGTSGGGTSGSNGSIPRCDDLPPDTLC
jgi:hypothetical protein